MAQKLPDKENCSILWQWKILRQATAGIKNKKDVDYIYISNPFSYIIFMQLFEEYDF